MSSHSDTGKFFRGVRGDVSENYRLLNHLGSGANGEVWAAMLTTPRTADEIAEDVKPMCEQKVAIKKIHNCFGQATEAKRILRELRILRHLRHNNIISIRDVLAPTSESSFSDLWVVFDFVDLDLRKLIASNQTITTAHVQWICHQMLSALLYLHSAHVLHRDLKPANVLLSGACDVKICDFGLSRVVNEEDWKAQERRLTNVGLQRSSSSASHLGSCPKVSRQMTSHVVTRWYRAPELILLQPYTTAIDVWSFACIFAELLLMLPEATRSPADRNALFPGQSCFPLSPDNDNLNSPPSLDQLNVIFQVLGTPSGPFGWVERAEMREYLATLEPRAGQRLEELVPGSPAEAIDLLRSMLQFRPSMRCSVAEAMDHPFFEGMAARAPATLARWPVDVATIDFEGTDIRIPQLRKKILGEIRLHSERGSPRADGGRQVQLGESDGSHRTSTDGASTGGASTDGAGTGSASTGGAGTGGASNDNACVGVAEGDSASSSSSTAADGDRSLVPATNDPAQEKRPFEEEVLRNVRSRRCSREHPKAESQPESGASLTHHVTPSSHDTDGDTSSSNPSLKP